MPDSSSPSNPVGEVAYMKFNVVGNKLTELNSMYRSEQVTSNSINYSFVEFTFNEEWNDLDKLVIFKKKDKKYEILLDSTNQCNVPHEVLKDNSSYSIGLIGNRGSELQIATNYYSVKPVLGAERGETANPPTPSAYQQILELFHQTEEIANSVREDADNHKFDGCGIESIDCTGHRDNVDIYTITLSDGRTYDYEIINAPSGEEIDFSVAKYLDNHPGIFDVENQIATYLKDHPPVVEGELLELTNRY